MDLESILIPLGAFVAIVAVFGMFTGLIGQWITNRTVREALRSSPENLKLVADKMQRRRQWSPETWGLIGIAIGAAMAVAGLIGDPADRIALLQIALLPGFVGAALLGQRWLPKRQDTNALPDRTAD